MADPGPPPSSSPSSSPRRRRLVTLLLLLATAAASAVATAGASDPCDPNPCLHAGACTAAEAGATPAFSCGCQTPYSGPTCQCGQWFAWDAGKASCMLACEDGFVASPTADSCMLPPAACMPGTAFNSSSWACEYQLLPAACEDGYHWDMQHMTCAQDQLVPAACQDGYVWDSTSWTCQPLQLVPVGCAPGTAWNPSQMRCDSGLTPVVCEDNHWFDSNQLACVTNSGQLTPAACEDGYQWDPQHMTCVVQLTPVGCMPGYTWSQPTMRCEVSNGGNGQCGQNQAWDEQSHQCVSVMPVMCDDNFHMDWTVMSCVPNPQLVPVQCEENRDWDMQSMSCRLRSLPDGFQYVYCQGGMQWDMGAMACMCEPGFITTNNGCQLPPAACVDHAFFDFLSGTCMCMPNYVWSPFIQQCISNCPGAMDATGNCIDTSAQDCISGYFYDTNIQRCIPNYLACNTGFEFDTTYGACLVPCPDGFRRINNEDTTCFPSSAATCYPGTYFDEAAHLCRDNMPAIMQTMYSPPAPGQLSKLLEGSDWMWLYVQLNSTVASAVFLEPIVAADLATAPELVFYPSVIVFDPAAAWNGQWVAVRVADDSIVLPTVMFSLAWRATAFSNDTYAGLQTQPVHFLAEDNDHAGVQLPVTPIAAVEGSSVMVAISLTAVPQEAVLVVLSAVGSMVTVADGATQVFTPENWATPGFVLLTIADDNMIWGDQSRSVVATAYSADASFDGWTGSFSISISENDFAGVRVDPSFLYIQEGDVAHYTLSLTAQPRPGSTVIVTPVFAVAGTVHLPDPVTFDESNWSGVPVTVQSIHDGQVLEAGSNFIIVHTTTSADEPAFNSLEASDAVLEGIVANTDVAALQVFVGTDSTPSDFIRITEGSTITFSVTLTAQPAAGSNNHFEISGTLPAQLTLQTPAAFTGDNWDVPHVFTLRAPNDDVVVITPLVALTIQLHSDDTVFEGLSSAISIIRIDDDGSLVTVDPVSVAVTESSSSSVSFRLPAAPTADVTLDLSLVQPTSGSTLTLDKASLVFTTANWDTVQTVRVSCGVDHMVTGSRSAQISLAITTDDAALHGATVPAVQVRIADADVAAVVAPATAVIAEGTTKTFAVKLSAKPSAAVVVSGRSSSGITVGSVTIQPANWNTASNLPITVDNNFFANGNYSTVVSLSVTTNDPAFKSAVGKIDMLVADDDMAGFTVNGVPAGGLTEGGASVNITVALTSKPYKTVFAVVTGDVSLSVPATTLVFTTDNWNHPQKVRVAAVADRIDQGPNTLAAAHFGAVKVVARQDSSSEYASTPATATAKIAIIDVDTAGVTVSVASVTVAEGGSSVTYKVRLNSKPRSDIVLTLDMPTGHCLSLTTSRPDYSVACSARNPCARGSVCLSNTYGKAQPPVLTYSSADWATDQTVTVTADDDSLVETAAQQHAIDHIVTSAVNDPQYVGMTKALPVAVTDNDKASLRFSPSFALTEGKAGSYKVYLTSQPFGTVTVTPHAGSDDVTVATTPLVFSGDNWSVGQSVAVTVVNDVRDPDTYTRQITHTWTSTDTDYTAAPAPPSQTATVTDDDTAAVLVSVAKPRCVALQSAYNDLCANCYAWNQDYSVLLKPFSACSQYCLCSSQPTDALAIESALNSTIMVRLASKPTAAVTITLSSPADVVRKEVVDTCSRVAQNVTRSGPQVTMYPATIVLDANNWATGVSAKIVAASDGLFEGRHSAAIKFALSSSDGNYKSDVTGAAACAATAVVNNAVPRLALTVSADVATFAGAYKETRSGCRQYAVPSPVVALTDLNAPAPNLVSATFGSALRTVVLQFDGPFDSIPASCGAIVGVKSTSAPANCQGATDIAPLGTGPTCWSSGQTVVVQLGRNPTLTSGQYLVVKPNVIKTPGSVGATNSGAKAAVALPTGFSLSPGVKFVNTPEHIGSCDKLPLQVQASNTGARDPVYTWSLQSSTATDTTAARDLLATFTGPNNVMPVGTLPAGTHTIKVSMQVWYQATPVVATVTVQVDASPKPTVTITTAAPIIIASNEELRVPVSARSVACALPDGTVPPRNLDTRFFETTGKLNTAHPELFADRSLISGDARVPFIAGRVTRTLRVPANTLIAGQSYTILVQVSQADDATLYNQVSIEVQVTAAPLVASLGSTPDSFTQRFDAPLTLDASSSSDPSSVAVTAVYLWTCRRLNVAGSDSCGLSGVTLNTPVLNVPASKLPLGLVQFTFTFTKGTRTASKSVVATVVSSGPTVSVDPIPYVKVAPGAAISVIGHTTNAVSVQWSQDSGSFDASAFTSVANAAAVFSDGNMLNLPYISFLPGVLQAGRAYTFRLTAFDAAGVSSSAMTSFLVNAPPSGGVATVSPQTGEGTVTQFTVTTDGWNDDASDLPIKFFYLYSLNVAAEDVTIDQLSRLNPDLVESASMTSILPPGTTAMDHHVTIAVGAQDIFGAVAVATTSAVVSVPNVDDPSQFVQDAANGGAIKDGLDGGDAGEAQSAIATFSSFLSTVTGGRRLQGGRWLATLSPQEAQSARLSLINAAIAAAALQDSDASTLSAQLGLIAQNTADPAQLNTDACNAVIKFLKDQAAKYVTAGVQPDQATATAALLVVGQAYEGMWLNSGVQADRVAFAASLDSTVRAWAALVATSATVDGPAMTLTNTYLSLAVRLSSVAGMPTALKAAGSPLVAFGTGMTAAHLGVAAGTKLLVVSTQFLARNPHTFVSASLSTAAYTATSAVSRVLVLKAADASEVSLNSLPAGVVVTLAQTSAPANSQVARCGWWNTATKAVSYAGCLKNKDLSTANSVVCVCSHLTDFMTVSDSPAALTTSQSEVSVSEATPNTGATYTVALSSQPSDTVTVDLSVPRGACIGSGFVLSYAPGCSSNADCGTNGQCVLDVTATVTPASVTFSTANWNSAVTITVKATNDAVDEANVHDVSVAHKLTSTDSSYSSAGVCTAVDSAGTCTSRVAPAAVSVVTHVSDDDTSSVVFSKTTAAVSEAGATDSLTVKLGSSPLAPVTVTLKPDAAHVGLSQSVLTFNSGNWNSAAPITVRAVDDSIIQTPVYTSPITNKATSNDPIYAGLTLPNIVVSITDNDTAAMKTSVSSLRLAEKGGVGTYKLTLAAPPVQPVTIRLSSNDITSATVSPATAVFTSVTWNQPVTVTVTAVDDSVQNVPARTAQIIHNVTTTDSAFKSMPVLKLPVTLIDNDVATVLVNAAVRPVRIPEGSTASYSLVLGAQPTSTVTVAITSSAADVTTNPASVQFTANNWYQAQTVVITAVQNNVDVPTPTVSYTLTHTITTTDASFQAATVDSLGVEVVDDDNAGLDMSVVSVGLLEGGVSQSYLVKLLSQPTASVTITLGVNSLLVQVNAPASKALTFTTSNWNVYQTVKLTAVDDQIDRGGALATSVNHTVASADANYNGRSVVLPVTVTDNDGSAVLVSTASLVIAEGSSATFTVFLSSQPTSPVTVSFPSPSATVTLQPCCSVVFDASNWSTAKTIVVNAVQDKIDYGVNVRSTIQFTVASNQASYDKLAVQSIDVTVTDDDTAALIVTHADAWKITTSSNATAMVKLATQPTATVRVSITAGTPSRVRVAPTTLTFTAGNYDVAQSVVVFSALAPGATGATVDVALSFAVTSTDTIYNALAAVTQSVRAEAANNLPPVANAGVNVIAWTTSGSTPGPVTLDGSASSDPEGQPMTYVWTQTSGASSLLQTPLAATTLVTSLTVSDVRVYSLTVTDTAAQHNTATVKVWTPHVTSPLALSDSVRTTYCVADTNCGFQWTVAGFPVGATVALVATQGSTTINICTKAVTSAAATQQSCTWAVPHDKPIGTYTVTLTVDGASVFSGLATNAVTSKTSTLSVELRAAFRWVAGDWSTCSDPCGGTQTRTATCQSADGGAGTPTQCSNVGATKPATVQECSNPDQCSYTWSTGDFSTCSEKCGSGEKRRTVTCKTASGNVAADSKCPPGSKPDASVPCFLKACSYKWKLAEWGTCSKSCGTGVATRAVTCVDQDAVTVKDTFCAAVTKPATSGACLVQLCGGASKDWRVGDWSSCTVKCGGGTQNRTVTCIDSALAPTTGCTLPSPAKSQTCNSAPCETFTYKYTQWSDCSKTCGGGRQYRNAMCVGSRGTIGTSADCVGLTAEATARDCNTATCPTFRWSAGDWGACSKSCDSGVSTRTVTCVNAGGSTVADSSCDAASKPATSRACNQTPCKRYWWDISAWSSCSSTCGGTRTRTVSCAASDGSTGSAADCGSTTPLASDVCKTSCGFCETNTCSDHGKCAESACTCTSGYTGKYCQQSSSCSGVLTATGQCCTGVLDEAGACCAGASAVIDATGACCKTGILNACGKCDDGSTTTWITDVVGNCCHTLDAGGYCCDGVVDACGVCGGVNACSQKVDATVLMPSGTDTTQLNDPASSTRQSLDADLKSTIAGALDRSTDDVKINTVGVASSRLLMAQRPSRALNAGDLTVSFTIASSGTTTSNLLASEQLNTALTGSSGALSFRAVTGTSPSGVCGNSVCEVGERCDARNPGAACCSDDCPIPVADCPTTSSGKVCNDHGACITTSSGQSSCQCYSSSGYAGDTCETCADGFVMLNGKCQRTKAAASCSDGVQNGDETGVDCGGSCGACNISTVLAMGLIIGAAVLGGVLLIAFVCLVYCCCKTRRQSVAKAAAKGPAAGPTVVVSADVEAGGNKGALELATPNVGRRAGGLDPLQPVNFQPEGAAPMQYPQYSNPMHKPVAGGVYPQHPGPGYGYGPGPQPMPQQQQSYGGYPPQGFVPQAGYAQPGYGAPQGFAPQGAVVYQQQPQQQQPAGPGYPVGGPGYPTQEQPPAY